jgi:hypothetical protein
MEATAGAVNHCVLIVTTAGFNPSLVAVSRIVPTQPSPPLTTAEAGGCRDN